MILEAAMLLPQLALMGLLITLGATGARNEME
ncbi:MAG: hypothetical protein K0Q76_3067, partial [Panacagrimonas sp.]|nr:hypothetical protein [Panacagrimonas sp.]